MACLAVASLLFSSDAIPTHRRTTDSSNERFAPGLTRHLTAQGEVTKKKRMAQSQAKKGGNKISLKAGHRHAEHKTVLQGRVKEHGKKARKRNPEGGGDGEPGEYESRIAGFLSLFAGLLTVLWMCIFLIPVLRFFCLTCVLLCVITCIPLIVLLHIGRSCTYACTCVHAYVQDLPIGRRTIRGMHVERQKNRWTGIENIYTILNAVIGRFLKAVEGNVPLAPGELHAKKIVTEDGTYQNYAYMGLGTKLKERLEQQIEPINGLDTAARDHDIVYTQFQQRLKNGEIVTKQEVRDADEIFIREVIINKHDDILNVFVVFFLFLAKKDAEDKNLISHTAFVV